MTSTTQAPSRFGRGGEGAVAEAEATKGSGASFRKTHYLPSIGKGKYIVVRYLLDSQQWYYAAQHPGVPTKAAPQDWPQDKAFPKSMPAICRYDKSFQAQEVDLEKGITEPLPAIYNDCYICDAKLKNTWGDPCNPVIRVWTLAVLREEVIGTQEMVAKGQITADKVGKRAGFKDASREVDVPKTDDKGEVIKDSDGKMELETIVEPAIIVINQPVSNYFGGLQSMFGMYGTVCDRDYAVQQNNEGKKVDYVHLPLDVTPNHHPGSPSWQRYTDAIAAQGNSVDIEFILMDRSSDEYYATFFDPSKTAPKRGGDDRAEATPTGQQGAPVSQQAAAPQSEPASEAALTAMRDRVRGLSGATTTTTDGPPVLPVVQENVPAPAAQTADAGAVDFS